MAFKQSPYTFQALSQNKIWHFVNEYEGACQGNSKKVKTDCGRIFQPKETAPFGRLMATGASGPYCRQCMRKHGLRPMERQK